MSFPSTTIYPGASTYPSQPEDPFGIFHEVLVSFDDVEVREQDRTWELMIRDDGLTRLRSFDISGGRDSELEDIDATTATHVLDSRDRLLDPTNSASEHFPNLVSNRMLWHRVHTSNHAYTVFKGYVDGWGPGWDTAGLADFFANVRSTDGKKLLTRSNFQAASPDVEEYEEVISADDPSFYYTLGEEAGTKVVSHLRSKKWRKLHPHARGRRKRWRERVTKAEVGGISGPSGTYKNTPLLGQPGPINGSSDTSVLFRAAQSEYARIQVDQSDAIAGNRLTMESWVKIASLDAVLNRTIIGGPMATISGVAGKVFELYANPAGSFAAQVRFTDGTVANAAGSSLSTGEWYLPSATWDGDSLRLYVDGVLVATDSTWVGAGKQLATPDAGEYLHIGAVADAGGVFDFMDGWLAHVAIYETVLSSARLTAHYEAAAYGFPASTTGRRIENTLALADLWGTWGIHTGERTMPPDRYAGRAPVDLVDDAADGEGIPALFFFQKDNIPRFLDSNYRQDPPYDAPIYSFTSSGLGGIEMSSVTLSDTDAFLYNVVTGTNESGEQTFTAEDAASIARFGRSVLPLDSLPISNEADTQTYVDERLAAYKDPMLRIASFTVIGKSDEARRAILTLEIGDCVDLHFFAGPGLLLTSPNLLTSPTLLTGGVNIEQVSYVERRHVKQDPGEPLIGEFSVSPR